MHKAKPGAGEGAAVSTRQAFRAPLSTAAPTTRRAAGSRRLRQHLRPAGHAERLEDTRPRSRTHVLLGAHVAFSGRAVREAVRQTRAQATTLGAVTGGRGGGKDFAEAISAPGGGALEGRSGGE